MLDNVDPLPDSPNGAPRSRPSRALQLYKDRTWSHYLDDVIQQRAEAQLTAHHGQLQAAAQAEISDAIEAARAHTAALADGEVLTVDAPRPISELHRAAAEKIDESTFDADKVRSAGPRTIRHIAENGELEQLVRAGN